MQNRLQISANLSGVIAEHGFCLRARLRDGVQLIAKYRVKQRFRPEEIGLRQACGQSVALEKPPVVELVQGFAPSILGRHVQGQRSLIGASRRDEVAESVVQVRHAAVGEPFEATFAGLPCHRDRGSVQFQRGVEPIKSRMRVRKLEDYRDDFARLCAGAVSARGDQ